MRERVWLMKRGLYYRANWSGYTSRIEEAGRYWRAEAERHVRSVEGVTIHEITEPHING